MRNIMLARGDPSGLREGTNLDPDPGGERGDAYIAVDTEALPLALRPSDDWDLEEYEVAHADLVERPSPAYEAKSTS